LAKPTWGVTISSTWLGSGTGYTFPGLTTSSGWDASWNSPTGVPVHIRVEAVHANPPLRQLLASLESQVNPDGTSIEVTQRNGGQVTF